MSFLLGPCLFFGAMLKFSGCKNHWTENYQTITSWWLNQPIWKIWSSNWIISPGFGVKIKNVWVTTNINTIRPALEQEHIDTNKGDQKLMDHQDQLCLKEFVALLHLLRTIKKQWLPSRELTYPPKMAFWRWLSFSPGGICWFPGGYQWLNLPGLKKHKQIHIPNCFHLIAVS